MAAVLAGVPARAQVPPLGGACSGYDAHGCSCYVHRYENTGHCDRWANTYDEGTGYCLGTAKKVEDDIACSYDNSCPLCG